MSAIPFPVISARQKYLGEQIAQDFLAGRGRRLVRQPAAQFRHRQHDVGDPGEGR